MSPLAVSVPVPAERARLYRAEGLWGHGVLADGIEAAAAQRPEALALADNSQVLTYAQLRGAVVAGVARLSSAGVSAGDGVVLVAGNTAEAAVAFHALLRVGATVVLLDRRCGSADVHHAVAVLHAPARVVAGESDRRRLVEDDDVEVVALESFGDPGGAAGGGWTEPDRDAAAVVLFTSGTTGRPKGAIHSLNTLTAGAANMARITAADEESVPFLVSPLASITGVMQLLLAADQRGALVLEDRFDPEASLARINHLGATLLGGAPIIAERLLEAARRCGAGRIALRTLALGGAMLPRPLLELATDDFGIEIARVYGSTEAPNFSGSTLADDREQRLSDDGVLMPGSWVRVGSLVHPREALLRGPGVFLGYANPADNAEAFEDDWYRTGDLVELDGYRLTVTGRLKEVVNRNGLKISMGEIDAALVGLPGALEQACFALPDAATGERLAVAVRAEEGVVVTLDDVVAHLDARGVARRRLPEQVVLWDAPLPRTTSGKIVRSLLAMESGSKPSELRSGR